MVSAETTDWIVPVKSSGAYAFDGQNDTLLIKSKPLTSGRIYIVFIGPEQLRSYFGWKFGDWSLYAEHCSQGYAFELVNVPYFSGLTEVIWTIEVRQQHLLLYCQDVLVFKLDYDSQDEATFPHCATNYRKTITVVSVSFKDTNTDALRIIGGTELKGKVRFF